MIIKEIFSKFKDNSRTNCTFLEFREFSSVRTLGFDDCFGKVDECSSMFSSTVSNLQN